MTSPDRSDPTEPGGGRGPGPGTIVLCIALAALVLLTGWGAWASWRLAGDARMSIHGWIAMGIAAVFTAALTGGLAWLAFYSARAGYDDDQPPP